MGEGTIFDKWEAAGRRAMQRDEAWRARWAAIERAARWPLLSGAAVAGLALGVLAGWPWWPWAIGVGLLAVLALAGVRQRLGPAYMTATALLAVDAALLSYVNPWWWGLLAGIGALGFAAVAGTWLGWWQHRRTHVLAAAVAGLALLATSAVVLAVHAAQAAEVERQQQAQAHEQAVARILPRTPASMVNFLAERITRPTPEAVADACFVFSPDAQRQLADAQGGGDCAGAIRALAARVTDPSGYVNRLWLPGQATQPGPASTLTVDACALDFGGLAGVPGPDPGPQLGHLTLTQQHGEGHRITAYRPC
ncbi:hypothetical protein SAMN04489727_2151 [Amycolatopsis tolypomycina]|uniref:Uncharacterized protein n=1 Tax=Amycolatopsis tolypomycina TaxID=208445 RepID=A0A1H4I4F5_9PSEU|nr:hypothetical protein [Amycolatopsis tolypomycina]SEB28790.1 hypothetical protein SAMN04489727_0014 [Amycolatopsis tolypomycina]SEB49071.1 hypothetical protein SAMN04489727_2151 [Amycolatopsis tolypomycina]